MKKIQGIKKPVKRRHISDVPFYQFEYGADDLPLDPAKTFILQKIHMRRTMYPSEFATDMNLHAYHHISTEPIESGFIVPSQMMEIMEKRKWNCSFENEDGNSLFNWSSYNGDEPSDIRIIKVTKQIVKLYIARRMKLFRGNKRIVSTSLKLSRFASQHKFNGNENGCRTFSPPKKRSKFQFNPSDEGKLRKPGELQKELERMSNVIDELIKPQVEKYERELKELTKRKLSSRPQIESKCLANKTNKVFEIKQKIKKPTAKEFMEKLKSKEMEMFKYRQSLLPVDPDQQKNKIYQEYYEKFNKSSELFTEEIRRRTLSILNHVRQANYIETRV